MSWLTTAMATLTRRNSPQTEEPAIYDWTRYWCARDGTIALSDGGFLVQPGGELFESAQDVVPFSSIATKRCLVLLGEPGVGKSVASHDEYTTATATMDPRAHHRVDLRGYSEFELRTKLFEADFFKTWVAGDNQLLLYLDSLDECLDRVDHVAELLRDELASLPHTRLTLWIVSRTADWPTELEEHLRSWWGADDVSIVELAPLTRRNAADAANASGLDSEAFMRQVDDMDIGPLASKPLTLQMLLNIYRSAGSLPESQADVYRKGCLLLCDEPEQQRRRRQRGRPSAEQRLAIAERIAAATILANKRAIWTAPDRGDVPVEDALPGELTGGVEGVGERAFEVDEALVRDTITTGLFTARGPHEMGWAHLAYGEFLAGSRLADPSIPLATIKALIAHPADPSSLTPQLRGLVAWLAGMRHDVREWVVKSEPRVLLRSDASTARADDRTALVNALFAEAASAPARIFSFGIRPLLRRLANPRLAEQLREVLLDKGRSSEERTLACDIAEVNAVVELHDTLISIALDGDEPQDLRVDAARAVALTGSSETNTLLKPLVEGSVGDPTNDLVGWALRALWPEALDPEELFSMLVPYGEKTHFGAYWMFVTQELVAELPASHLTTALAWTRTSALDLPTIDPLHHLVCQIFEKAWGAVAGDEEVADAFAEAALARLEQHAELCQNRHDSKLETLVETGGTERRTVAEKIVSLIVERHGNLIASANRLAYAAPRLVRAEDLPWLAGRMEHADEDEQRVIVQLMYSAFDPLVDGCLLAAVQASDHYPLARERFRGLLGPIDIGSEEAATLRTSYDESQAWKKEARARRPPVRETAAELLQKFEAGDWDAWWRFNGIVSAPAEGSSPIGLGEPDLTVTPGWGVLDDNTRALAVVTARKYLEAGGCAPEEWLGKDVFYWPAFAGYAALRLLLDHDLAALEALEGRTWQRWAAIVVAAHGEHTTEGHERQKILIQAAFRGAPEEVASTLLRLVKDEDKKHGDVFVLDRMPLLSGQRLENELFGLVETSEVGPTGTKRILSYLATVAPARMRALAYSLIEARGADRDTAVGAATALLITQPDATLDSMMDLFESDTEFATAVMAPVASAVHWKARAFTQNLSEQQLARLFRWLEANVTPVAETGEVRARGPADFMADLLNNVLKELSQRGSLDAVVVLQALRDEFPQHEALAWLVEEAAETMRRTTWVPPSPPEIVTVLTAPRKRLVQSAQDLLEVVMESLERLQVRLQGETPLSQFLWNFGDRVRPKDEEAFSDLVKDHLQSDLQGRGIIAAREVEIRRGRGGARGEETDIHVSAVRLPDRGRGISDSVRLIIETKGNWHPELLTAMKTQLADRYLADNDCRHGLYLAGWFNCAQWDDADPGRKRAMRYNLPELRAKLDDQAAALSIGGLAIRAVVLDTHLR